MKITFIQTLLICLGISLGYAHTGVSQELLDRKVTLNLDNVEIKKVLVQIERQAKVKFVYSPNAIGATRRVSVVAVNRKLSEVLNLALKPLNISYRIIGGQIMLQNEPQPPKTNLEFLQKEEVINWNVRGVVTDENGDPPWC